MDQAKVGTFRKKMVEDDSFRAAFAKSPGDALRSIGIEIPKNMQFPSMDKKEIDQQVEELKKAAGGNLSQLYSGELSERDLDKVAGCVGTLRYSPALQQNSLFRFSSRLAEMPQTIKPGDVYTISAFGTLDW
jgi:hypothetical protein